LAEAEHRIEVDDEEPDRGVVDEKEETHAERRHHDVDAHHLAPGVPEGRLRVDSPGPGLDEGPLAYRDHDLVAQGWGEFPQCEQGQHEHDESGDPGDVELVFPGAQVVERVGGHLRHDQAADDRPQCPQSYGCPTSNLGREVTDQGRSGHQHHSLDESHRGDADRIPGRVGCRRNAERRDQTGDQQARHDQIGAAPPIGQAGQEGGYGARHTGDHHHRQVVAEGDLEVGQDRGGHGPSYVLLVVADDRGQDDHGQVAGPGARLGVVVELAIPQPPDTGGRSSCFVAGDEFASRPRAHRRHLLPPGSAFLRTPDKHLSASTSIDRRFGGVTRRRDVTCGCRNCHPDLPPGIIHN
jgi:hypothetical protein